MWREEAVDSLSDTDADRMGAMPSSLPAAVDKSTLRHIYITDSLSDRPAVASDPHREKHAILELAAAMADDPAEVLPRFVALAMELTGATSAGLSLFEEQGEEGGVFRWSHLHGSLSPFEDALTPRFDSPCGVTLDQNRTVLARHPELVYDWISNEHIVVPEVLLQPLHLSDEEPLGTLWVVAPEEGHVHADHARVTDELARFAGKALRMIRTERRLRSALGEQEMLAMEMSHRLKNLFAITDGMIRGSARNAATVDELAELLSGRLHALASAHALVRRQAETGTPERSTMLGDLIAAIIRVHDSKETSFAVSGCEIHCGDQATNGLALVIHELATNASKYGALSVPGGAVDIAWSVDADSLALRWTERGGPALAGAPSGSGFGSTLIKSTIERQLRGRLDIDWAPEGLKLSIAVPTARLAG